MLVFTISEHSLNIPSLLLSCRALSCRHSMALLLGKTCRFLKEIKTILARLKNFVESKTNVLCELIVVFEDTIRKFEDELTNFGLSVEDRCSERDINKKDNIKEASPLTFNDSWSERLLQNQDSDVSFSLENSVPLPNGSQSPNKAEDWADAVLTAAVGDHIPRPNPILLVANAATECDNRIVLQEDVGKESGVEAILPTNDANLSHELKDQGSERQHVIELKTRCPLCHKGFDRNCRLRQHMFIKHEGELWIN